MSEAISSTLHINLHAPANPNGPNTPMIRVFAGGAYTAKYRARQGHHHAPLMVHWISVAIRLNGRKATNGTWSGRAVW